MAPGTSSAPPTLIVRWMVKEDLPRVLLLERKAGDEDIWQDVDFYKFLARARRGSLVAIQNKKIVGFLVFRSRRYDNECLRLVAPDTPTALALVKHLSDLPEGRSRNTIVMDVRESNLPLQQLLKACGFLCGKIIRGKFDTPPEAGYHFLRRRLQVANGGQIKL